MFSRTVLRIAAPLALALFSAVTAPNSLAADTAFDDQLRLNTSVTVRGHDVKLGDLFTGYLSRPEKVVAQAPRPGQRMVLSAEWLDDLARTYGLDWRAANGYDRTVVFQPGQTIAAQDILAAVKADLTRKGGLPADHAIAPTSPVPAIVVAEGAVVQIGVREAYFDAGSKSFAAVVEIPPETPEAQFINLRGKAFPVVTVPALKDNTHKNTVITADMLTVLEMPVDEMKADTVTDAAALVGKAPKIFLRGGFPIRETDVAQMTLIDVPVLKTEMTRDNAITDDDITYVAFNTADLPRDVVTDAGLLVGKTPRRFLAAGAPVRRGDVQIVRQVRVPVAARDLIRGAIVGEGDVTWVTMNDNAVSANVITDEANLVGLTTKHGIRAGQTLRAHDVLRPVIIPRGKLITIVMSSPVMTLTAQGQAMEPGSAGDVIRVANTKSKTALLAEVVDAQTVRVVSEQIAMR